MSHMKKNLFMIVSFVVLLVAGGSWGASDKKHVAPHKIPSHKIFGQLSGRQGRIPFFDEHYKIMPGSYDFSKQKLIKLSDKIRFRYILGTKSMLVQWHFKKGAVIKTHYHPQEQTTLMISGKMQVMSQGETYIISPGDVIIFPPNVPHYFKALEDSVEYDFFTPVRQDWFAAPPSKMLFNLFGYHPSRQYKKK